MTSSWRALVAVQTLSNHFSILPGHNEQSSIASVKPETRNQSFALLIDIIGGQVFINSQTRASDRKGARLITSNLTKLCLKIKKKVRL